MEEKLPKNWFKLPIDEVAEILDNKRKPVSAKERAKRIGDIPYYGATGIAGSIDDFIFDEELVLLGEDGAPFFDKNKNVAYIIKGKSWVNNHAHVLRAKPNLTSNKYLLFYLNQFDYTNYVGGTTRLKLTQGNLKKMPVFLAPLHEQYRIVTKLDTLFKQLKVINASLDKIPVLLKNFRQQVLSQAVTGKLTEEWRKRKKFTIQIKQNFTDDYFLHPIPPNWVYSTIGKIGDVKGGKRLPKGEELVVENTGLPYIRARDLKKGTVLTKNLMFLTKETQEKIKRYTVREGDLYITIVGAKIGDAGIIPPKMNGANLTENAAKITALEEEMNNKYIAIWLKSAICQNNIQQTIMSAAQGKLALTRIKQLPIYIPPYDEQNEILKTVEALLTNADAIEKQYKILKEKINTLPQSILHKAFKGELVSHLESDGDARELLEGIEKLK